MAKTILLNNRKEALDRDPIKVAKYCHLYIDRLKKKESWLKYFNTPPNEEYVNKIFARRELYNKMLENFNTPSSGAEQNITQEYVFRSILRLLVKKHSDLAYHLFKELEITPSTNPYFPELGLFFAKKNKNDTVIWLEYFLINQKEKKPVDFEVPDQVSILLQETFTQEMPDFQVNDQELDFIRTLQFLLFLGKSELIFDYLNKLKDQPQNIETKNFIWGLGILLNDKKILMDYEDNAEFFRSRTWDIIKAIRK